MTDDIKIEDFNVDPDVIEEMLKQGPAFRNRGPRRGQDVRYIGAPVSFVRDVCTLTDGRAALVVALLIYRRMRVCGSPAVTLPAGELAALDIDRRRKSEALGKLQAAGLIKVQNRAGHTAKITLLWRPSLSSGEDTQ
jgi:hypothetical protein